MKTGSSVQRAHDELLAAMPAGAAHDACSLCHPGAGEIEKAKEGADVADLKYTEEQHVAILTDAVQRETASLATVKETLEARIEVLDTEKAEAVTALTETQSKLDVLEAEKSAALAKATEAEKALEDFKAELARAAEVEKAREDRVTAIKAADESLEDEFFTEERVQRWAEMSSEHFDALVSDLTEAAAKRKPAFLMTDEEKKKEAEKEKASASARESAAFSGGTAPTAGTGSALTGLFQATGKLPAAVS